MTAPNRSPDPRILVAILIGIAAVAHVPMILGADALDSDRALVIMMARALARGEFSLFFWGQNYMAMLEGYLLTPFAMLGILTPVLAAWTGVAVAATVAWLSIRLTRTLGGTWWLTALLWALPPAVVAHHHIALYGARLVSTLIVVGVFSLAIRATSRSSWALVGCGAGLAYLGDHLMIVWIAAILYAASRRGFLKIFVAGALPWIVVDTVVALGTPAVHLAGPNNPSAWIHTPLDLIGTALPQLFGLLLSRGPGPTFEVPAPIVPEGVTWLLFLMPAVVVGLLLLKTGGSAVSKLRRSCLTRATEPIAHVALGLVCLVSLGLFLLVGGDGEVWSMRYLVPAWPAITILAGVGVRSWSARLRPWSVLLVLPALYTHLADATWPNLERGADARVEAADVSLAIVESGAAFVWADYWDAYRFSALLGPESEWLTLSVLDRRPEHTRRALQGGSAGYLLRVTDLESLSTLDREIATQGGPSPQQVGRYRLYVLDRSLPELVTTGGDPGRLRSAAAALAPALLFLIVALTAALLPIWLSPPEESPRTPSG